MSERSIFAAALDIADPAERSAYLDRACAGEAELRRHVEDLLAAQGDLGSFLARPPVVPLPTVTYEPITEGAGSVIGRYKLLQQIGEGGFGSVYMAEQREPVKRRVALKIIKLGMDTREVIARFEAERQALALMDHPNIARVLDAGTTESGRPFFVMELIKGVPLAEFCDRNLLPARERLALFTAVCQAVQHAHQKGIIHRDLKPSNILVTLHDGKPVPKVIDFGVAKALNQELTEKTLFTAYGHMVGTPQYMSPEQAEMSGLDIDTRSDVYSLGVLLYELLTGTTPLEARRLRSAGYAEMQRLIREEEAPRPSTRVSTLGERLSVVARDRQCEPCRLSQLLRGELDWIVLKALEKDRTRRYDTAAGLARDVERYLADEPVEACPPTFGYRLRKAYRKHRAATLIAAGFAALLLAGVGLVSWQAVRATGAENEAREQRDVALTNEALARQEAGKARAARDRLRRTLYVSRSNLIQTAWDAGDVARVLDLLEQQRPGPGEEDLRGFEWHYFDRLCHADLHTVKLDYDLFAATPGSKRYGSVVLSADGSRCAAVPMCRPVPDDGLNSTSVTVWDVATGRKVFEVPVKPRLDSLIVNLSRDGRYLVLSAGSRKEGELISLTEKWDVDTGRKLLSVPSNYLEAHALNSDGRRLAAQVRQDGRDRQRMRYKIWDLDGTKEPLEFARPHVGVNATRSRLCFSGDKQLMLLDYDAAKRREAYVLTTIDVATGQELATQRFLLPVDQQRRILRPRTALSPDATRLIATVSSPFRPSGPAQAIIWEVATGNQLVAFPTGLEGYCQAIYSPDGKRVALWSNQGTPVVKIWHAETGSFDRVIKGHTARLAAVAFSPDGERLCSADVKGTVKVWDVRETNRDLPARSRKPLVMASKDGTRQVEAVLRLGFVSGEDSPTEIRVRDTAGTELLVFRGHKAPLRSVEISADGRHVVSADSAGEVRVWETATGRILLRFQYEGGRWVFFAEARGRARRWELSPDGRRVAVALPEGGVKVWELDGLREIFATPAKPARVRWTPGGRRLVTTKAKRGEATVLQLWDVDSRQELFSGATWGDFVPFSRDGRRLALTARRGPNRRALSSPAEVKVVDVLTGTVLVTFKVDSASSGGIVFSPDGSRLAIDTRNDVLIADVASGKEVFRLKGGAPSPRVLAFSPDGKRLASTTQRSPMSGTALPELILWDLTTASELMRSLYHRDLRPRGYGLFFSPDGHRLWVGGVDKSVRPVQVFDGTPRPASRK